MKIRIKKVPENTNRTRLNEGDVIWDNMGQWKHPGKVTGITGSRNGTDITMRNVGYPVVGIDNLGNYQYMTSGNDYHYPGNYVVEYPVSDKKQFGGFFGRRFLPRYDMQPMIIGLRSGLIDAGNHNIWNVPIRSNIPFVQRNAFMKMRRLGYNPMFSEAKSNVENSEEFKMHPIDFGHQYVNRLYGKSMKEKQAFVEKSFDDWYHTFRTKGHSHDDSIRMSKFFAL